MRERVRERERPEDLAAWPTSSQDVHDAHRHARPRCPQPRQQRPRSQQQAGILHSHCPGLNSRRSEANSKFQNSSGVVKRVLRLSSIAPNLQEKEWTIQRCMRRPSAARCPPGRQRLAFVKMTVQLVHRVWSSDGRVGAVTRVGINKRRPLPHFGKSS